jgi:folate-binding protein YgfZ
MDYCTLDDQGLVIAEGADALSFLQGQVTNDLRELGDDGVVLAAVNTPPGRVLALARIVRRDGALWLFVPRALATPLVEHLRRYVLRAKVKLADASQTYAFASLPGALAGTPRHAVDAGGVSRITLPGGTLLAGAPPAVAAAVAGLSAAPASRWTASTIAAGDPAVPAAAREQWIAQMINLDLVDGISFKKGCYTGQEIVARTQHLGRIKRRMFRYRAAGPHAPATLDPLLADGAKVGEVVTAAADGDVTELLAVVTLEARDRTLTTADGTPWTPVPLPYAVT